MKIGIVIVTYDRKDLLEKCLASVVRSDYPDFRVFVVDNGSKDGTIEMVKKNFSQFSLVELGKNTGFCEGNNRGIWAALKSGCEAVVLLNNDTEVEPRWLGALAEKINAKEKIGMVAAKVIFAADKKTMDSSGLLITPDGLVKNRGLGEAAEKYSQEAEVFCPAGAAALYSRELLEDIVEGKEFLDEKYRFYFEEFDLGLRARLRGWKCVYAPEAIVCHVKSATAGAYSELIAYHTNRNIFYTIIKDYPFPFCFKALGLSFSRYFVLALGALWGRGPAGKIKNTIGLGKMLRATFRGWANVGNNLFLMLRKRKSIQRRKVVSYREVQRWFKELGLTFWHGIYR